MSLGQKSLNKLVDVVYWLCEGIAWVDPVKEYVTDSVVAQLKRDFLCVDIGALLFVSAAPHEDQCLVTFADEPVVLSSNGGCSVRVFISLNIC